MNGRLNTKSTILIFIASILLVNPSVSGDWKEDIRQGRQVFISDLVASGETVSAYFLSPIFWDRSDWMTLGGMAGASALALPVDKSLRREVQEVRGPSNHWLMRFGRHAGDGVPTVLMAYGFYSVGLFGGYEKLRVTGRLLFEGFFTAGATTSFLKTVAGRHRPYTNDGPFVFTPLGWENRLRAFPSGHSTIGWVTAGVLAKQIDNTLADILLYSSATVISASRIYHDKHWLSDVIFGGFVGYTAADFVVRKERERQDAVHKNQSKISFDLTPQPGIAVQWQF